MSLDDDLEDEDFETIFRNRFLPWVGGISVAGGAGYGLYKAGEFLYEKAEKSILQGFDYLENLEPYFNQLGDYLNFFQ